MESCKYPTFDSFDLFIRSNEALFHFTKLSTVIEKILPDMKLRMNKLTETGDPREYNSPDYFASLFNYYDFSTLVDVATEKIHNLRNSTYVSCLTSNNIIDSEECYQKIKSGYGFNKSRMWSQYADNHRGICLVFSKPKIISEFMKAKDINNVLFCNQVKYTEEFKISEGARDLSRIFDTDEPSENTISHISKFSNELYFQKHLDYSGEMEYRFARISLDKDNRDKYIDITSSLVGILIGDAVNSCYYPVFKNLRCPAKKLVWASGEPFVRELDKK